MMEYLTAFSLQLFSQKCFITDVCQGSKYTYENTDQQTTKNLTSLGYNII